ncbi:hypothetical protein Scep_029416 [Stephania cephalantha]|uniref:Uncharacterized protein n=1 Tax=Stephania cephalantha TaxID=152367 RepID=A0AAP0DXL9_9MAGN
MDQEFRVFSCEEIELGAHRHGGGDRGAERSDAGFDDEAEGVQGVVGAVVEFE